MCKITEIEEAIAKSLDWDFDAVDYVPTKR